MEPTLASREVSLRSVIPSAFLPAFLYEIGNGAVAPVIVLTAVACGASAPLAAFMVTLVGIGRVLGDVPSSALAHRLGERRAMMLAAMCTIVASSTCYLARSMDVLIPALILIGMCNSTFYLGRQSYLASVIPPALRARAMSSLGGSHRAGLFLGPFLGAAAIGFGGLRAAYLVATGSALATAAMLFVVPDADADDPSSRRDASRDMASTLSLILARRRMFLTLGSAIFAVGAVRAARQTVLPLWAAHLGLSAEKTSVIFGVAGAIEMFVFYPAGRVMDRRGRLAVAVPSMLLMGGAMIALPLTHATMTLAMVAFVMGFGNGMGAGLLMTIGVDLAPIDGRLRFLSLWRVWSDSGQAAGPLIIPITSGLISLADGTIVTGSLGVAAALGLITWLPRYSSLAYPREIDSS